MQQETPEGADMRQILQTLRFPKPPANITIKQLFDKLDTTIPLVLKKAGADLVGKGIFNGFLSDKQWEILRTVQSDLNNEYKIRREMLLTRLDVTIQSFQVSVFDIRILTSSFACFVFFLEFKITFLTMQYILKFTVNCFSGLIELKGKNTFSKRYTMTIENC